ncbi:MAG TPA: ferritin-like domain-containing protein [Rhodospirillales bacterium]|nr:ferritin-like domain-containing protein [Rhodospirillales bacterium]
MGHWTIEDIPWARFAPDRLDPDLTAVVKAASLVEHNSADYADYLCNVFADDPAFQAAAREWAVEEAQHGEALGRWGEMADPGFDFAESRARFRAGYRIPVEASESVRGSRSGELTARCVVETGTSSFYSALRDASREPVLKVICAKIAGDEFRHYKLFYTHMQRYLESEKPSRLRRVWVAVGRYREADDDELAFAYHCANTANAAYDRKAAASAYAARAYRCYRRDHVQRAVSMILKATGLSARGRLGDVATNLSWRPLRRQARGPLAA